MTGDEIRAAREARGWTQQQLADAVEVGSRTIGNWERGETVPKNRLGMLRKVFAEPVSTNRQGADQVETDEFRFQRPEGMSDEAWRLLLAQTHGYIEGLIEQASQER